MVAWNTWRNGRRDDEAKRQGKVVDAIHILTNSAMGDQLKVRVQFAEAIFVAMQRIAALSHNEEGAVAAAIAAGVVVESQKALLNEHLARQAKVDKVDAE
jgi:hypothetical protein